MYASRKHILKIDLVAVLFVLVSGFATAEDVILYDKAPSVDELQRQLTGGGGKKNKERAIVFGDSEPAPQETAPAMQPASPQANFRPELNQQAQSLQADTKQQATRESKKAIAFPINFRVNSAEILPAAIPFLEAINGLMQKNPGIRLIIEGHTDISGNPARNNLLSRERAYSVVNYLVDHYQIEPTRLTPVGKGFSEPLEGTDATNPKNRRVQFRLGV